MKLVNTTFCIPATRHIQFMKWMDECLRTSVPERSMSTALLLGIPSAEPDTIHIALQFQAPVEESDKWVERGLSVAVAKAMRSPYGFTADTLLFFTTVMDVLWTGI